MSDTTVINLDKYIKEKHLVDLNQYLVEKHTILQEKISRLMYDNAALLNENNHLKEILKQFKVEIISGQE